MMKRILLVLCASAALAGCTAHRSYGSWLDTFGVPPRSGYAVDAAEAAALNARIAQLQAQGEMVRVKMAAEPDRVRRIAYLKELRDIHDQVQPLRHRLLYGPTPMPSVPAITGPET